MAANSREAQAALIEGAQQGIYDIPEKLSPVEAIWYYNLLDSRRQEVYQLHFARLTRMEEWLEIYSAADKNSPAQQLAFDKLGALDLPIGGWIELHEARFKDAKIISLCHQRIEVLAAEDFDKWREVFDLAPFGSHMQQLGMRKMRQLAATIDDHQAIYDRCDIGSTTQITALQNILLLSRFEHIKRVDKAVVENAAVAQAAAKGPSQWRREYDQHDFYDPLSSMSVINIYLSADAHQKEA